MTSLVSCRDSLSIYGSALDQTPATFGGKRCVVRPHAQLRVRSHYTVDSIHNGAVVNSPGFVNRRLANLKLLVDL